MGIFETLRKYWRFRDPPNPPYTTERLFGPPIQQMAFLTTPIQQNDIY